MQGVADDIGVGPGRAFLHGNRPAVGRAVERAGGVELDRVFAGRLEAVALLREDMQQHRAADIPQHFQRFGQFK